MRKLLIINGLPGSGKGTQAEILAAKLNLEHISSGQLIRDALKSADTDNFAKMIKERYDQGQVQPDEVALKLIESKIKKLAQNQGVIFDSFPINLSQARMLEEIRSKYQFDKPTFIILELNPEDAIKRLSTRKICQSCGSPYIDIDKNLTKCQKCGGPLVSRSDDKPEVVRQRIEAYLPLIAELTAYYKQSGNLISINGDQTIAEVARDIDMKVNE